MDDADNNVLAPIISAMVVAGKLDGEDAAEQYERSANAWNTKRTYRSAIRTYLAWCTEQGIEDWVGARMDDRAFAMLVRRYLAVRKSSGCKQNTIQMDLCAINQARMHVALPSVRKHPIITKVMKGIHRHTKQQTDESIRKMKAITPDVLRAMLAAQKNDIWGVRNRALMLIAFALGMRRSELCGLKVADVVIYDNDAMVVTITHSKTDQDWKGRSMRIDACPDANFCPVLAMVAWQHVTGARDPKAWLFCGIKRNKQPSGRPLSGENIRSLVKETLARTPYGSAGFSGHSFRAGCVTTMHNNGATMAEIMAVTGHSSVEMVKEYIRKTEVVSSGFNRFLGGATSGRKPETAR